MTPAARIAHHLKGLGAHKGAQQVLFCAALQARSVVPDALEEAKRRVDTKAVKAEIARRRVLVHAALARGVPTEGQSPSCGRAA